MSPPALRLATRGSPLALAQARWVADALGVATTLVVVETSGDKDRSAPLPTMGVTGIFVKEVQQAVLEGRADLAVHSAKDLPSSDCPGLVIAAVPTREDPRDVLIGAALADLAVGAEVATGSPRRLAQLAWLRPDLRFVSLRGNIHTRLERVPPGGAVIMAAAALARLGISDRAAEILSPEVMLPQAGQGALAVECRQDDRGTRMALAVVDDPGGHRALIAERAVLERLGAGCNAAVAAYARIDGSGLLDMEAMVARPDGSALVRRRLSGEDPLVTARLLADQLLRLDDAASLL